MGDFMTPLLGALGAVGGGLLTANSIDRQNEQAESQFSRNYAFQMRQYQDMKRFQNPSEQVRMLREAGLNPALAMDSKLAGTSLSSVGGVAPTASETSGDFSSLPSVAGNLIGALNNNQLVDSAEAKNYADAALSTSENVEQMIDNAFKHGNNVLGQRLMRLQGDAAENDVAFQMMTMDRRVEQEQFKSALLMAQMEYQSILNGQLPERFQKEMALVVAQTAAAVASGKLSRASADEIVMRRIANFGLDKDDALDVFDSTMDLLDQQQEEAGNKALSSADGDIKSNPFTLNIRSYSVGRTHNNNEYNRNRRNLRRKLRMERHRTNK